MKKLLGNISLKQKLQILTFIPMLGLLYFIIQSISTSYQQMNNLKELSKLVTISQSIASIVQTQDKERAYSNNLIISKGESSHKELITQRKLVDKKYKELEENLNTLEINPILKLEINKKKKAIRDLQKEVRSQIVLGNLDTVRYSNALNFYTSRNTELLETLLELAHYSDDAYITTAIIAYFNILSTADLSGLNRSYGMNIITEVDNITDEDDNLKNIQYSQLKLKSTLAVENLKLNTFLKIADTKSLNFYTQELKKLNLDEYKEFSRSLANDNEVDIFEGESDNFDKLASVKIKLYGKVARFIGDKLTQDINNLISKSQNTFILNAILGLFMIIFTLGLGYLINSKINNDMNLLKSNLLDFFQFISKKTDDIHIKNIEGSDEFALLINTINKEVIKTKKIMAKDNRVLQEIDDVVARINNGFFSYNILNEAGSDSVELLKSNINNMINTTKHKLDVLNSILTAYGKYEYNFKLSKKGRDGMAGDIGTLTTSLLAMGEDISIFMATFSNVIDKLNENTHTLLSTSSSLATSSNQQAASLEQTAASLEELTATITSNSTDITTMSSISDQLNQTAYHGQDLSQNTSNAMEEIKQKVQSISDAIGIIDQIAFQTNILSLNAAVEAATAGEAGKGFAVVAGEVRNLAARSAEAAKEIKDLVEAATSKALDGEKIAADMLEGYTNLSDKIIETKTIIDGVSSASQEQQSTVHQINNAVSELDQMTQKNAADTIALNDISGEVERLSTDIENTINKATFDNEYKKMVCDTDLTKAISGYKRDHIIFKADNFAKLRDFKTFSVVDCNSCRLGAWINKCEKNNEHFTKLPQWADLKEIHERVHVNVQEYINQNAKRQDPRDLKQKALDIENDTLIVFEKLNQLLKQNCNG